MNKKKTIALFLSMCVSLSVLSSCKKGQDAVSISVYTEGMKYTETTKGTASPVYAISYEIMGGEEVMPIGGFYAPFTSGGLGG